MSFVFARSVQGTRRRGYAAAIMDVGTRRRGWAAAIMSPALFLAAACGAAGTSDRVSVMGVDRLSGELAGQEVDLPGVDLPAVRGPAAMVMLGASIEGNRVVGGAAADCPLRRKVNGALVARSVACVSLLGQYAAMERARQFLLSSGAEALLPAPVLASESAVAGLRYVRHSPELLP